MWATHQSSALPVLNSVMNSPVMRRYHATKTGIPHPWGRVGIGCVGEAWTVSTQTFAGTRFGEFLLDRDAGGLFRLDEDGISVPLSLGSRALDVLTILVEHRGQLVSKQAIMDAVWPDTAVEENNLTVQISALRRLLDEGRAGGSYIQTVPGRGYRLVVPVTREAVSRGASVGTVADTAAATPEVAATRPLSAGQGRRMPGRIAVFASLAGLVLVTASVFVLGWQLRWSGGSSTVPRLSIVVLPFQNLSGDASEDYLVDAITDDLTTDLSHIPEAFVIANASARAYKGQAVDVRRVGRELGVRYVVEGSVRLAGTALHVNVQLISTETGAHVWSDMFEESIKDLASGQDAILVRMRGTLGISLIEVEIARGRRSPQSSPDAFDLILRARALFNQPQNRGRFDAALSLYEQALRLDPSSVLALTGAAAMLMEYRSSHPDWSTRAETLVTRAREIAPASEEVLGVYALWLFSHGCDHKSISAARYMVETFPNPKYGYGLLSKCLILTGRSEDAIPLMEKVIRRNPRDTFLAERLRVLGSANLFAGHYEEAISALERALAVDPDDRDNDNAGTRRKLAAAYAYTGRDTEARRALAAANKDWPFDTVRGHFPDDINPVFAAQVRNYQEGLRRLGERDHADEDADFGILADASLRWVLEGYTPTTAPPAPTIRTAELPAFIAERKPVIIDPMMYFWGPSLPGAVGLRNAGVGGTTSDGVQERLGRKMTELTGGDLNRPIVAVGWNSERFDGRNLALRLVALGYTNVYWYRGGREAWEVNDLPETELNVQQW